MKTFKEFFIIEMSKKRKNYKKISDIADQEDIISSRGIGGKESDQFFKRKAGAHNTSKRYDKKSRRNANRDLRKEYY